MYLGSDEARYITEALLVNKSVTELVFTNIKFDNYGAWYIGEAIKKRDNLTNLCLIEMNLNRDKKRDLCEGITGNFSLTKIFLINTNLNDCIVENQREKTKVEIINGKY